MRSTDMLVWGTLIHLLVDWFGQNETIALNKSNPKSLWGYFHGLTHALALTLIFPWMVALTLGMAHWAIDLRIGLAWVRKTLRQSTEGPYAMHIVVWQDQVAHVLCIALAALFYGR